MVPQLPDPARSMTTQNLLCEFRRLFPLGLFLASAPSGAALHCCLRVDCIQHLPSCLPRVLILRQQNALSHHLGTRGHGVCLPCYGGRGGLDHLPSASGSNRNSIVEDGDGEAEEEEAFDGFGAAEEADADTEFNDTMTAIASATTASKSPSAGGAASTSHFVPTSPYRPVSRMSMVDALGGGSNLSLQVPVKPPTCTLQFDPTATVFLLFVLFFSPFVLGGGGKFVILF